MPEGERIAKVIARAGICSRRDAEKLILEGRVKLDGALVTSPAINVTENNVVQVDEKPLAQPDAARMWRYYKPSGLVTTHKDEKGRSTVFGSLPKHLGRVVSVGRLDFNSEGLLLLTNDGDIARRQPLDQNLRPQVHPGHADEAGRRIYPTPPDVRKLNGWHSHRSSSWHTCGPGIRWHAGLRCNP